MSKEMFELFNGDAKIIAKEIKKDLKELYDKDFKFSVRSKKFSGGQEVIVDIKKAPSYACYVDTEMYPDPRKYVKNFVIDQIKEVIAKYNYDNSDAMTDYFDVGFYPHINDRIE